MRKLARIRNGRFAVLPLLALWIGCGYPAAEPENLELITSLRTALSAKNEEWLKLNEEKMEARRAAGQMGDASYKAFSAIIAQARGGDWKGAELETVAFQKSQRPTAEQVQRNAR